MCVCVNFDILRLGNWMFLRVYMYMCIMMCDVIVCWTKVLLFVVVVFYNTCL